MDFKILWRFADSPSVISVISLVPPAIQHTHIQDTVHGSFLPAGAACFEWRPWIVQPHINALREEVRRMHLVVLDKRDVAGHTVVRSQRIDLMDEMFAVLVGGMRFSSKYNLNGTPLIEHHILDAIQIMKQ